MNTIVCYKIVPEEESITVNVDRTLCVDGVEYKVGDFDLYAIEEAVRLAEETGGSVCALTAGGPEVELSKMKKRVLSLGPEKNHTICMDELKGTDPLTVADALAGAVKKMETYDLIICGEGSSDVYAQQTGMLLGELLNIPAVNCVKSIIPKEGSIIAERDLGAETQILEITLPAVVMVTSNCNTPRLPSMKNIMAAGKKPTVSWKEGDIAVEPSGLETAQILALEEQDRLRKIVTGDDEESVQQFAEMIKAEL